MAQSPLPDVSASLDPLAQNLLAEHWVVQDGILQVEGHSLPALVAHYGSPLYVYSAAILRGQLAKLRRCLGPEVDVYYSVKANPNPAVLAVFHEQGTGFEIASAAEYLRAVKTGISADRIVFAGPGKTDAELAFVVDAGIGEVHLESFEEIGRLAQIAAQANKPVKVSVRVNPDASVQGGAMRMGGGATAFGFDESLVDAAVNAIAESSHLQLHGLHLFSGTQILSADTLIAQWNYGFSLAQRLIEGGAPIRTLDLGGGLGIPYFKNDSALDLDALGAGLQEILRRREADARLKSIKLMVEPGRFLAGPAGLYAARVTTTKISHDEHFTVTDGGMHHHLAATGNLGQVMKKDYPVVLANRLNEAHDTAQKVVGPLCTPLDTYGRKTVLPEARVGDIVAVLQSGAYGLSSSPVGFLSHPMPAEILVDGSAHELIRPRGTFEQPITPLP